MKRSSRWSRQVSEGKKGNREGTLHSTINNGEIWWKIKKIREIKNLVFCFILLLYKHDLLWQFPCIFSYKNSKVYWKKLKLRIECIFFLWKDIALNLENKTKKNFRHQTFKYLIFLYVCSSLLLWCCYKI